jgi:RNA polymerase sigma-70 factor, ECF subfamily
MEGDRIRDLMQRYAEGDESAFASLYALVAPRLYRFCRRLTSHGADADDLLQETFLRLHRARATYKPGANVLHWAFAIARAAFLDRLRYRRRRPEDLGTEVDAVYTGAGPESEVAADQLHRVVTLELARMSEKNRVAYVLMREEGLSARDAAAILGTTPDVVKQRAHRAYEQLRLAVSNAGWKEWHDDRSTVGAAIRA